MLMLPQGEPRPSPVPGKTMNCTSWGSYEIPGSSSSAALCHGGRFEGERWDTCQARHDCKQATIARATQSDGYRHLTVIQPEPLRPTSPGISYQPREEAPSSVPARVSQEREWRERGYTAQLPQPVLPPSSFPAAMRTPFVSAGEFAGALMSPTFLPDDGEEMVSRLGKNMTQGVLAAIAWQAFNFLRSIDIFGRR